MDFQGVITEIIRETSYKIDDFYLKSFLQGGITLRQANTLFTEIQKIKSEEFKVQAALQGVDIDKDKAISSPTASSTKSPSMIFGDPNEYNSLSKDEAQNLTEKMMGKHKHWAGEKKGLGGEDGQGN